MSDFDTIFSACATPVFKEINGDTITSYTPKGESVVNNPTVLFTELDQDYADLDDGENIERRAEVTVWTADVSAPGLGDELVKAGETWPSRRVLFKGADSVRLEFVRVEPQAVTRPNYRARS